MIAASSSSRSAINNRHSTIVNQSIHTLTGRLEAGRGVYARCAGAEIPAGGGDVRVVLVVSGAAGFYRSGIRDQAAASSARPGLQRGDQAGGPGGGDREAGDEPCFAALIQPRPTEPHPFGARRVRSCPKHLQAFGVFHSRRICWRTGRISGRFGICWGMRISRRRRSTCM